MSGGYTLAAVWSLTENNGDPQIKVRVTRPKLWRVVLRLEPHDELAEDVEPMVIRVELKNRLHLEAAREAMAGEVRRRQLNLDDYKKVTMDFYYR